MGQISNLRNALSFWRTYSTVITVIAAVLALLCIALGFEVLHLLDTIDGVI